MKSDRIEFNRLKTFENGINRLNKKTSSKNSKYGISLYNLPETYSGLLKNRLFVKNVVDDDNLLRIVFHLLDIENEHKYYNKLYYIKKFDKIVVNKSINEISNLMVWKCAFCDSSIEINSKNKNTYNDFICEDCKEKYPISECVDNRILQSFKKFIDYVKKEKTKDYKYLKKKMLKLKTV